MMNRVLALACVLLVAPAVFSGQTKITNITKTAMPFGQVKVDVEGTNELFNGEVFSSWTGNFTDPKGVAVSSTLVFFNQPVPGAGPKTFKFTITITSSGGSQIWWANSILENMFPTTTSKVKSQFAVP